MCYVHMSTTQQQFNSGSGQRVSMMKRLSATQKIYLVVTSAMRLAMHIDLPT
jgi:hypothetical protein